MLKSRITDCNRPNLQSKHYSIRSGVVACLWLPSTVIFWILGRPSSMHVYMLCMMLFNCDAIVTQHTCTYMYSMLHIFYVLLKYLVGLIQLRTPKIYVFFLQLYFISNLVFKKLNIKYNMLFLTAFLFKHILNQAIQIQQRSHSRQHQYAV